VLLPVPIVAQGRRRWPPFPRLQKRRGGRSCDLAGSRV